MNSNLVCAVLAAGGILLGCGSSPDDGTSSNGGGGAQASGSAGHGGGGAATASGGGGAGGATTHLVVDAGKDQTIAAPETKAILQGSATDDAPGAKLTYAWTQVSGITATIATPTAASTSVTGMIPGARTFRLTVTDDRGRKASDDVKVTVTSSGNIHYVAMTGSDTTGDGTKAKPWASLAKACTSVQSPGDTIHVEEGKYTETAKCLLAPRVNLEGEGDGSHLLLHYPAMNVYDAAIMLQSDVDGTNGDQEISKLWLDGDNFTELYAMLVRWRSNVVIHDCKFTSIRGWAVSFNGHLGPNGAEPTTYETGNQLADSKLDDCSDRKDGGGVVAVSGQEGLWIHGNVFDQTGREPGHNGNVVGAVGGHNKAFKYSDNVSTKPDEDAMEWNFAIESWKDHGGFEIWGNTFNGGGNSIDVGYFGGVKGDYDYSWYVHDNVFAMPHQYASLPYRASMGVQFETAATDAIIANNHFKNTVVGVQLLMSHDETTNTERIYVHDNLFEDMGVGGDAYGGFMVNVSNQQGNKIDSVYVDNNTMISGTTNGHARAAIFLTSAAGGGSVENVFFRNNIVEHTAVYGFLSFDGAGPISHVTAADNIVFDCNGGTMPFTHGTPTVTDVKTSNNRVIDPKLDADFHPLPGSPALGAGTDVGYGKDIGAFH